MHKFCAVIFLFASINAVAQQADLASRYASTIAIADLQKHLTIIAGEEMQGRETGTEGQRKAATYIESYFRDLGLPAQPSLKNGFQQMYPLYKDSLIQSQVQSGDYVATLGKDYIIPVSTNNNGYTQSKKIVFAGYGIDDEKYSDYTKIDARGSLLIIFSGEPRSPDGNFIISGSKKNSEWTFPGTAKKLDIAQQKGAKGVFIIDMSMAGFDEKTAKVNAVSRIYYPRQANDNKLLYANISHEFAKRLLGSHGDSLLNMAKNSRAFSTEYFSKKTKTKIRFSKDRQTIPASNVLGVIEGGDKKDEYVFLTAHYDHLGVRDGKIYYGADDDGSGTVAVLEMAEAFARAKADGNGPRRTVVCMAVSGEEKGLWGSEFYSNNPIFPLDKTSVDLNTDMIGRIDTERKLSDTLNYVYVVGHDKISSEMPVLNEAVNSRYTGLVLDYKFDDPNDKERIYFRSDHYNFARKGVPVLFFYDGMLKADYHKPTDTVDKINWPLYEKRARLIFHTAWEIANRNEMLNRDKPIPTATR